MKKKIEYKPVLKKFLMTLAATTISIILTFGTSSFRENRKQKAAKREMVTMILYDMQKSYNDIAKCDSDFVSFLELQLDMVAHPKKYDGDYTKLYLHYPVLQFTTTTENIFRTNIESIRTIGNILFVEVVSSFYDNRQNYLDIVEEFNKYAEPALHSYEKLAALDATTYSFKSHINLENLRRELEQSKLMMKITDEDLDKFSKERERLENMVIDDMGMKEAMKKMTDEQMQWRLQYLKAKEEGRKELSAEK